MKKMIPILILRFLSCQNLPEKTTNLAQVKSSKNHVLCISIHIHSNISNSEILEKEIQDTIQKKYPGKYDFSLGTVTKCIQIFIKKMDGRYLVTVTYENQSIKRNFSIHRMEIPLVASSML